MHVVQHFFCFCQSVLGHTFPDLIVPRVTKEANADDNVPLQRQALLSLQKSIFEPGAAAERYDFIFPDHFLFLFRGTQIKGVFIKNHANSIVIQSIYRLDIVDEGPDTTALTIYQFFKLLN